MSVIDTYPQTRAERRKSQTRELLRQAARQLLTQVGYQHLTIKAITDRADLGYGTFYLHYEDKDTIVWEITKEFIDTYIEALNARLIVYPFLEREYLGFLDHFQYLAQTRQQFLDLFGPQGSAYLCQQYELHLAEIYERHLRAKIYSPGELDLSPLFMAQFMAGAMMRLTLWWLENDIDYTPQQMADMVFEMFYRQPPPAISPR